MASPTYYRLQASFRGRAAHAGIRPEAGRNAIAAAAARRGGDAIGRLDAETTANVGRIEGGTSANVVAERCVVELEARSLDVGQGGETVSAMVDAAHRGGQRFGLRRRDLRRAPLPGLPPAAHRAGGARSPRGRSQALRDGARLHRHRRGQRRKRAHRRRPAGGQPRQRHRAQPPARRVGDGRGPRGDARRDPGDRGPGGGGRRDGLRAHRLSRPPGRAGSRKVRVDTLPLRRRRGGRARDRGAPRLGGGRGPRRRAPVPRAPAARGGGRAGAARAARPASSTRRGRSARHGQARAGGGDRQGRPRLGAPHQRSGSRRASPTRRATCSWPPGCTTRRRRPDENERIEIVERAARRARPTHRATAATPRR